MHLPASLFQCGDALLLDDQACNGLRLWAEHFDRLIILVAVEQRAAPASWVPLDRIGPALDRIEFVHLPTAWRPDRFLRVLAPTRKRIRAALAQADYVGTTLGGASFGDWGAVIAREAHRMELPFFIWTDRVEPDVLRRVARKGPWRRRLRLALEYPVMRRLEHDLISKSALGLFHGRETYEAYAPHCRNPHIVHNVHIHKSDRITPDALARKMERDGPVRIVYAGRADPMKGTGQWLDTLSALVAQGHKVEARWLGEGPDLDRMRARVAAGPLAGKVALPGFVSDRAALMDALRDADMLLFCHLTPESPRILIEALAAGCPLVGYDSAYPADLLAAEGGGVLTPLGDPGALAKAVAGLVQDRARLRDLIAQAARAGSAYDDEQVFAHRAALIKTHMPRVRPSPDQRRDRMAG